VLPQTTGSNLTWQSGSIVIGDPAHSDAQQPINAIGVDRAIAGGEKLP